jgi:tetratricopeptide (TPR) repeat protein
MSQTKWLLTTVLTLVLQACATPELPVEPAVPLPDFGDSTRFGLRPEIPTPEELHQLTPEQEADFLTYFNHPSRAAVTPHRRLFQYLENLVGEFQYDPDTRSATDVLLYRGGNCLSLAIVTTALAQLADIAVGYQLMADQPVFEYQGSVVIKGVHISTLLYNPEWLAVAGTTEALRLSPGMRIDYFPELRGRFLANIDNSGYLAQYYDNIASGAIARGDYATAYWYLLEALNHVPDHGASLNMLAVVNRHAGDLATAEGIYRYGIAHADDKLSLLKNYHTLLTTSGRGAEAEEIQSQLDTMNDPSPLHWLQLARASHEAGDWNSAIRYYQRVLRLAPYMHEVQLGLALSYYAAGELNQAENALQEAVKQANRVSTRNLYKAKLLSLRGDL